MPRPCNSSRVKFKLPGKVQSCLKTGFSDRGYHTYVYVGDELVASASLFYQLFNTERSADDRTCTAVVMYGRREGRKFSPKTHQIFQEQKSLKS